MKADGPSSRKYSLEGLYFLLQINCLLSQREAYRLIWNRSVKRKNGLGGNIPIDLAMEHYIRIVKILKRKLGPSQSNGRTLQRYTRSLGFTKVLVEDFDESTDIIQRSGRHVKKSALKDKTKLCARAAKCQGICSSVEENICGIQGLQTKLVNWV